jgi:hypothetical protein
MVMIEHHKLAQSSKRLGVAERNLTRKVQSQLKHMEEDSIFFQTIQHHVTPHLDPKGKNFSVEFASEGVKHIRSPLA